MHKIIGKLNHMLIMLCLGRGIMHVYILFLLACPCSFVFYFKNMDYFRNRGPSIFSIRSPEHSLITLTSTVPWLVNGRAGMQILVCPRQKLIHF